MQSMDSVSDLLKQSAGNNARKHCCSVAGAGNKLTNFRAVMHAAIRTYNMIQAPHYQSIITGGAVAPALC